MALERLVVCICGHDIDLHQGDGCAARRGSGRCRCPLPRDGVLDSVLNAEREEIRRQWLPKNPQR